MYTYFAGPASDVTALPTLAVVEGSFLAVELLAQVDPQDPCPDELQQLQQAAAASWSHVAELPLVEDLVQLVVSQ